ncbi:ribonuclease J, partial [Candidatus Roizmanbacteria bacterium]|nr:ribonuclease J [Candidatus Roizmanbacteria bacterium]
GDVGSMVLRDRKTLSSEGIVVAIVVVDPRGILVTRPKLISRGFVFEKGEEKLFSEATKIVEARLKPGGPASREMSSLRKEVTLALEEFFYKERGREPLVIVDVIET